MTKYCNLCKIDINIELFHKGNGSLGLKSRCIECCKTYKQQSKEYKRKYYNNNLEKARECRRRHQRNNREEYRTRSREYDKLHKPERAAREAFRRAQKLNATPNWLTKEHKLEIQTIYILRDKMREETGIIYHVDHIIPLISDVICGLHVPWNLQVLDEQSNLQKGNKV